MKPARTRFAPSPTGALHPGVIRTALFAWLLARNTNGQFLLRIEDTDQKREVAGSVENIQESLRWLGLNWDEGPGIAGLDQSYIQSERLSIYRQWGQKLVANGRAYADPYTPEQLDEFRQKAQAQKRPFLFRDHRPENPPAWDGTQPLRLKSQPKIFSWHDEVMGVLEMGPEMIDDFILIKSDGFPTYNFAHIIDDYEMGITHVMRSQEFLSSIPKYLDLYGALEIPVPVMAIVPPVLREDGRKKLSKREGAKELLWYRNQGYTPEAMLNFMATLGWNDGTEQEIFSCDELIEKFSLDRVQKSGAKFDEQRLMWMNGYWIRKLTLDELYDRVKAFWPDEAAGFDEQYKRQVLVLVQERLKFFAELPELTRFFFADPAVGVELFAASKQTRKISYEDRRNYIDAVIASLESSDFSEADLEQRLRSLVTNLDVKPGALFGIVRAAITGSLTAPGLFETLHTLGKEISLNRLRAAQTLPQ